MVPSLSSGAQRHLHQAEWHRRVSASRPKRTIPGTYRYSRGRWARPWIPRSPSAQPRAVVRLSARTIPSSAELGQPSNRAHMAHQGPTRSGGDLQGAGRRRVYPGHQRYPRPGGSTGNLSGGDRAGPRHHLYPYHQPRRLSDSACGRAHHSSREAAGPSDVAARAGPRQQLQGRPGYRGRDLPQGRDP